MENKDTERVKIEIARKRERKQNGERENLRKKKGGNQRKERKKKTEK